MKVVKNGQDRFAFNPMPHTYVEIEFIREKYGTDIVNDCVFNIMREDIERIRVYHDGKKYRIGAWLKGGAVACIYLDKIVSEERGYEDIE